MNNAWSVAGEARGSIADEGPYVWGSRALQWRGFWWCAVVVFGGSWELFTEASFHRALVHVSDTLIYHGDAVTLGLLLALVGAAALSQ